MQQRVQGTASENGSHAKNQGDNQHDEVKWWSNVLCKKENDEYHRYNKADKAVANGHVLFHMQTSFYESIFPAKEFV